MAFFYKETNGYNEYKPVRITIFSIVCLILIIGLFSSFYTIETGEIGVLKYFSSVTDIKSEGLHFKIPFISSVDKMSIRDIKMFSKLEVSSKDIQTIEISSQLAFSIPQKNARSIYQKYKLEVTDIFLYPLMQEKIQSTIAKYPIDGFVENRPLIAKQILKDIQAEATKKGIIVSDYMIMNHDFSEEFNASIEQKKIAEQKAQKAEYELQQTRLDAEAQKLKQASLSPFVLQEMAIKKWDGKLPTYYSGDQLPFISTK